MPRRDREYSESLQLRTLSEREMDLFQLKRSLASIGVLSLSFFDLLEAMLDLAGIAQLGLRQDKGMLIKEPNNPEIRLDENQLDALSNATSYEIKDSRKYISDEELSKFFNSLGKYLIKIKEKVISRAKLSKKERIEMNYRLYSHAQKFYAGERRPYEIEQHKNTISQTYSTFESIKRERLRLLLEGFENQVIKLASLDPDETFRDIPSSKKIYHWNNVIGQYFPVNWTNRNWKSRKEKS